MQTQKDEEKETSARRVPRRVEAVSQSWIKDAD